MQTLQSPHAFAVINRSRGYCKRAAKAWHPETRAPLRVVAKRVLSFFFRGLGFVFIFVDVLAGVAAATQSEKAGDDGEYKDYAFHNVIL